MAALYTVVVVKPQTLIGYRIWHYELAASADAGRLPELYDIICMVDLLTWKPSSKYDALGVAIELHRHEPPPRSLYSQE